jgi:predicted nucleic acid-binding protein
MISVTRTNKFVVDTVALILRLEKRKMGDNARAVFADLESGKAMLYVPSIVFAEILYLSERNRISLSLQTVRDYMQRFPGCQEYPLTFDVVEAARSITDIPELHDRLIAATASYTHFPLITNDLTITTSNHIQVIW